MISRNNAQVQFFQDFQICTYLSKFHEINFSQINQSRLPIQSPPSYSSHSQVAASASQVPSPTIDLSASHAVNKVMMSDFQSQGDFVSKMKNILTGLS